MMELYIAGLVCIAVAGCQRHREEVGSPPPVSVDREVEVLDSVVDVADVMDALQMRVWKVPFNRGANDRVDSVTLCIESAGAPPRDIHKTHLRNQPGEVLICLQETANQKLKLQLMWRGNNGSATQARPKSIIHSGAKPESSPPRRRSPEDGARAPSSLLAPVIPRLGSSYARNWYNERQTGSHRRVCYRRTHSCHWVGTPAITARRLSRMDA